MKAGWMIPAAGVVMLAVLVGCGGGDDFKTAKVRGKVTAQGQPVTDGSIVFRPLMAAGNDAKKGEAGKPASAPVQKDGSYVLTTYKDGDGAVVGKHEVRYSAPRDPYDHDPKPGDPLPKSPYDGLTAKDAQVEVKAGVNEINVELVPRQK